MPDQSKKRPHAGDNDDVPERDKTPENTVLPPEQQRSTKETPAKLRSAHASSFQDGELSEKRMLLLCDLEHAIPEVELDKFLSTFLPPLKSGMKINSIKTSLEQGGIIADGRWSEFPDDPSKSGKKENAAFQPLQDVFDKVVEHAIGLGNNLNQTFALRLLPNTAPKSERQSLTRPDGCFILKEVEDSNEGLNKKVYRWYDLALTCEFKRDNGGAQRDDNVTKIAFSMQHTMTLDTCRRFTFGITIENTEARLWFCSRAIMAVSEPFNFITDPDRLIHVFLSLAFATKTELGWDPTITVEDPNAEKRVYVIKVKEKSYKVEEVLSDFGADAIIGRATRVFKVKCLEDGESYVLKDVWVEDDRVLEHEIYDNILNDVKKHFGDVIMKKVASHLLTPVEHWLVTADGRVDGQEDHTKDVMMRGESITFAKSYRLESQDFGNEDSTKAVAPMRSTDREVRAELNAHLGSRVVPNENKHPLRHRRHYRVVYQETAQPIWTLTDLSNVFLVLRDSAKALKYIHDSGWVHRDISAGNIYFFDGRGLIGDLEYAKEVTKDGSHQMRTGTPDFMAVEVAMAAYQFNPKSKSNSEVAEGMDSLREIFRKPRKRMFRPKKRHQFVQNEAHDVESLWWIAIYILFFNRDDSAEETQEQEEARLASMQRIFPSSASAINRLNFLKSGDIDEEDTWWFSESFLELRIGLEELRSALVGCYIEVEKTLPNIAKGAFDTLHEHFILGFDLCMGGAKARKITISSFKSKGRQRQKDLSSPPPADDGPIKITMIPRLPEKKLGLRRRRKRDC